LWRTLAICDRWPWPVRSGGQHRLAAMLKALNELGGLEICIVSPDPFDDSGRAATSVALPTARVVGVRLTERPPQRRTMSYLLSSRWPWWDPRGRIDFPATRDSMRTAIGHDRFDVVWAYTTLGAPLVHGWGARIRMVDLPELLDVMRRQAGGLSPVPGRPLSRLKRKYLQAIEVNAWRRVQRRACAQASHVAVPSETDCEALDCRAPVLVVPNGYEIPSDPVGRPDDTERRTRTLMFQGTMSYFPNRDAADFFAREVFPLIRQRIPDAQFRVVGPASPEVLRLAEGEGVLIVGAVERIEDELAKADAVVVPLRIGSGSRLKILEAWAHRIPVISTTVGAAGLPASQAENLLLADSPLGLADACIRILTDQDLRAQLAETGRQTVASSFDWADIQARFLATLRAELGAETVAASRPRSGARGLWR
jgi:polysaccharide biosynthesis protein PslH